MIDRDPIQKLRRYKERASIFRGSTFFRLAGVLTGAGLGFLIEKTPEGATVGAAAGGALAFGVEKFVVAVGRRIVYEFVNK